MNEILFAFRLLFFLNYLCCIVQKLWLFFHYQSIHDTPRSNCKSFHQIWPLGNKLNKKKQLLMHAFVIGTCSSIHSGSFCIFSPVIFISWPSAVSVLIKLSHREFDAHVYGLFCVHNTLRWCFSTKELLTF